MDLKDLGVSPQTLKIFWKKFSKTFIKTQLHCVFREKYIELFQKYHGSAMVFYKSLGQAFSKACGVLGQRPKVLDKFIFFVLFVKIIGKVVWQPKIFIDFCLPYDIMNVYWKQKCVLLFRTHSVELIFRILFNLRSEILCQTAHSSIFHAIL